MRNFKIFSGLLLLLALVFTACSDKQDYPYVDYNALYYESETDNPHEPPALVSDHESEITSEPNEPHDPISAVPLTGRPKTSREPSSGFYTEWDIYPLTQFLELPQAQGQYNIVDIISRGQYGINWHMEQIDGSIVYPANQFRVAIEYPIFTTLPNEEFTEVINRLISDEAHYFYDKVEMLDPDWQPIMYTRAEVAFANPQLVSIRLHVFHSQRSNAFDIALNFNPTTGERYTALNFIDVDEEFVIQFLRSDLEDGSHPEILRSWTRRWQGLDLLANRLSVFRETGVEFYVDSGLGSTVSLELTYEDLAPFLFTND